MLNADVVSGFVRTILSKKFDQATETPEFHTESWALCCSKEPLIALAAPRGHAKTTGITISYGLATLLFRERKFMLLVSDTEAQAMMFLGFFKEHLQNNEDLIKLFGLKKNDKGLVQFVKDTEADVIVELEDGHKFRIIAKGAEQKLRGLLWDGSRPDIILCHEKNTDIYTPETGWIKNQEYPNAKEIKAQEAYKITFDNGHEEVVSGDHRFLTKLGWKYVWELREQDQIETDPSMINDILKKMQKKENKVYMFITLNQKLKSIVKNGLRSIWINTLLQKENTTSKTKKKVLLMLKNMLEKILPGKLLNVPKDDLVNSEPYLLGLRKKN